jgi:hypothetical protein
MSRADATLDDFLGVDDPEPSDEEKDAHGVLTAASWDPDGVQCQCGADITEWHPPAQARRLARVYGTEPERVPACPACVDWGHGNTDQNVDSVAHAVNYMETEVSVERQNRREIAIKEIEDE